MREDEEGDEVLGEGELRGFAVIGSYRTARQAHDAGLAVLASGHAYWVQFVEGRYLLVVSSKLAGKLKQEVDTMEARNRFWPPRALDLSDSSASKWPSVGFVALLVFVFWAQYRWPEIVDLGLNSSAATVGAGQWWRVVTAVTLHADIGHLAGNLMGISIFAYLCCRYFGNGLAWLLIFVAAGLANVSSVVTHVGSGYSSLGASTAVFAALGLLSGFPVGAYLRSKTPILSRDWLVPFFGGCVLFAWMGGGEFPTDVAAHFWSFGYGVALATLAAWTGLRERLGNWQQVGLLVGTLGLLGGSWALALGGS